jgi:hypothetical protein
MVAVANTTNAKDEGPKKQSYKKKRKYIYVSFLDINEVIGRNGAIDVAKANRFNAIIEEANELNKAIKEANGLNVIIEEVNELNAAIEKANGFNAAIEEANGLNAIIEEANGLNIAIEEVDELNAVIEEITDPMDIDQSSISDLKHEFEPGRH